MRSKGPTGLFRGVVDGLMKPDGNHRELVISAVCEGFCEYFKGRGGEPGCAGFGVVKAAVDSGRIGPFHLEHLVGKGPGEPSRSGCLIDNMCADCGYLADGCDFMAPLPPPGATPCGGYRIMQMLLESRALTQDQARGIVEAGIRRP